MKQLIVVSGEYAYVVGLKDSPDLVDIGKLDCTLLKECVVRAADGLPGVVVSENYAYVASKNIVEVIDISNPAQTLFKGSITHGTNDALLNDTTAIA